MKLTELAPEWIGSGGDRVFSSATGLPIPRREQTALWFEYCPCGCGRSFCIHIENPPDGLGPSNPGGPSWHCTGDSFDNLTLAPSIQRADPDGCRWHGFITNGEVLTC
jgi:hypothetical protein